MNKFGQKIRDCGHPRISSARPGAAMASVRNWAVPAVMAAALMLSGCQTLDPDSAEGESNSLLKAIAVAFVGGAAVWGGSGGGGSDDRPLLPTRTDRLAGAFSDAVFVNGQYRIDTPSLDRAAGSDGFPLGIQIPIGFRLAPEIGTCNNVGRCVVMIPPGQRAQRLILEPPSTPGADDLPPLVSLIRSNNYDILPTLGFFTAAMSVTQGGRATFRIVSTTTAPAGGLDVSVMVDGEAAGIDDPDTGRLAAIAAIVGSQANNHVSCDGNICTVTIPEGEISATFRLIPQGLANRDPLVVNRWMVSLMPGTNFEIEMDSNEDNPVPVANTPTGVRGGFSPQRTVNAALRRVATETPLLDRAAGPLGFDIDFMLPENTRPVAGQPVICRDNNMCTVTIPPRMLSLEIILESVLVADVLPTETGFVGDGEFGAPTVTDAITGEVSILPPTLAAPAPLPRLISFTIADGFEPADDSQPGGLDCQGTACTVTIPMNQITLPALRFRPVAIAPTDTPVAIDLPDSNDYTLLPEFFVGFSTLVEPTRNPDNGEVTFTFVSDTVAPVGGEGVAVSFRITGDAFTAMLTDDTPLVCQGNVCTVVIPAGSNTVAFVLVPQRPDTTNWRVAIVPDTNDNYGIDDDSQTPVAVTTTPPPAFFVGFDTPAPTRNPDNGEVTFTFVSGTVAPALGLTVSFRITGDAFTAMLTDDTPLVCQGNVCTVVIPAGSDRVAFILVPQGPATTNWSVAIVPDTTNNIYGIDENSRTPVAVTTTPPPAFFVGFDTSAEPTVDPDNGEVTFTFVSETAAPDGGLEVSFSITGDAFTLPDDTPLDCEGNVCTVRIPAGRDTVAFILVPQGRDTTWTVAIVPDTTNNIYGINDDSLTPVEVTTLPTPFVVGFSTPQPAVDTLSGNVTFTFVSETNAPAGGLAVSFRITGPAFTARLPNGDELDCPGNVCTVRIPEDSNTAAFILVPQGPDPTTTWSVAIVPDTNNIYGINDDSQAPVAVTTTTPPAVSFSTPQPAVDTLSGNATFTVRSIVRAPAGGLAVSFRIEGEGFTARLPNGDELVCPLNVCTVRIPVGTHTATLILVPLGPEEGGSSDLNLIRWTVTLEPNANYAIDDAPVIVGEFTLIAEGEADFTLDRNAPVRFGEVTALFRPQALPGDLDILEIPHASRITAESNADSFASGYGYFADDGGFLPFDTSIVDLGFSPSLTGNFVAEMHMGLTGQTTWRLRRINLPAPSGGYRIGIRVGGVAEADFTAMLEDRTVVECPNSVCELTIPAGETRPPNLVLTPTGTGFDPLSFGPENWMLEVAPIPRGNPLSPDPLSNNRANSDEAIFYARRGDKLVARFHTTGTFMTTAIVEAIQPFTSFLDDEGNTIPFNPDTALPPFVPTPFDPDPFNFLPGTDVNADCSNLASNTDPRRACNIELNAHEIRQTQLQTAYSNFGTTYLTFVRQVCRNVGGAGCAALSFNINSLPFLIVDGRGVGFRATALNPRPENARSVGEVVDINRPVAIALPITSTLVAADDDVQELVYSYFQDLDGDGMIDLLPPDGSGFQFEVFETITVGSLDFALYESGEIPNALPPSTDFSISEIDPSRELLGRSNVRTFLYENEFSAIGAWLIPPTAEEVNADANAPYYAAAAHWFGFQTPVDRIPTAGQAVYGGIATGDFRQVTFDNAGVFAGKRSFYVHGNAQFEADFANDEMDGQFELFAFRPQDVYGDPTLAFAEPLDLLVVNWEGHILPDGRGFANNSFPAFEPLFDRDGNPVLNAAGEQLARQILAPAATLLQPLRVEAVPDDLIDPENSPAFGREPVFDNLVQVGDDSGIPGAPPGPSPIGDGALFSVFGKFFGPGNAGTNPLLPFPEEVAGELRVFNSLNVFEPEHTDTGGNLIPEIDETVTSVLEVHFTATGDDVPDGRFDLPDIPLPNPDSQ